MAVATSERQAVETESRFGRLVVKGILYGIPIAIVLVTLGIYFGADQSLGNAIGTAALPGVLLGVFAGGFAGTALSMLQSERSGEPEA